MLKGKAKRSLAFVLAACMLLALLPSFGAGASAANVSYTEVDPSVIDAGAAVLPEAEQDAEQDVPAADEEVHVIILFEQKSLAKKGFSTKDLLEDEKAASYSSSLKKQQLSLVDRIEREALGGEELEIRYQFTVAVNGVATVVPYGRIEQILAVDGVADVYLEERYELDETVQPDTATAGEMVGSYSAWADGYTGAGSRIAIIDTGLDLSHPSFSEGGYYYSLGISAASFGKKISDYNLLTKEEIKKALPNLSISADKNPPKADDLYRNAKVPFAYNYVDDGLDVSHDAEGDSNGDHGTHVAGIAAANRYVPHYDADGDLYYDKQELGVTGVAPDAQLVVMKVFGVGGGAYSSDYMAAIEDAIWLNCDSVNLSLGSGSAGRSYGSKSDQQILDSFRNTDTVETVVLLSHKKPDGHINVKVEFGEGEGKVPLDNIAKRAESYKPKERVTYKMIKEYIEAKYGFKVHTAYIAEVKRDLGLPMYDAPNAVEELKQPRKHPTAEKVEAIKDALKHFEVI